MAASPNTPNKEFNIYRYKRKNKAYTEVLAPGVELTLMQIPAGSFSMGAPKDEFGSKNNERPQHLVEVRQFLIGRYPVTQEQWRVIASLAPVDEDLKPDPSYFKGDKRPVEQVSWDDAQEFCKRLKIKTGREYRLPSEAEWEYACRAGSQTPFHFGETVSTELGNVGGSSYRDGPQVESRDETTEVGNFAANAWGLHDMHGNVLEWCEDDWHRGYEGAPTDGSAWVETDREKTSKMLRGGSWYCNPGLCRSAIRTYDTPFNIVSDVGFRVCCVLPRPSFSS